ncbi:DUF3194 domain-containing protein [Candidatus Bathyarchaeota archaeon]|nr:DUF3194 domain-containing protein [Candidatus Bathyarchaeota archaeon]NIU81273.1 DUF3194 domain-containing protein [Candidatus Bathyarchaeota archaeon]NIV67494.1 DUF3194 domain-containing protein [Candidatus Bathyarchaeota archaeon]NIW16196.1 DUF3194 domain-containing protein [Candidatus Bathyarchaeota archaeon]NIW34725.1 DUF3194 domain-containing protein [Candidatus Bathyarchaeota archaeon]
MKELGLPELTSEQVEELCEIAERSARKYVLSEISVKKISTLNITVDARGTKPVTVNVDVDLNLAPNMRGYNVKKLANEATQQAFNSIEKHLRKIACKSTK